MAYITKLTDPPCYECSQQCISIGIGADDSSTFSRNIRVSITANPDFWGFGGVLISGWATYSQSHYDFFDGLDLDHEVEVACRSSLFNTFTDAQRPDVLYRSVYDPDTGKVVHYGESGKLSGSGTLGVGGAEAYLINRPTGLVATGVDDSPFLGKDGDECEDPPYQVFSKMPDNYGWANKILFNRSVYKNISGAWRLSNIENCYDNSIDSTLDTYTPSGYLQQCDGTYRQNILDEHRRYEEFEPRVVKGSGISQYYEYYEPSGMCIPDGVIAKKYGGRFYSTYSIYRNNNASEFIHAKLRYGYQGASGLKEGMSIGLKNDISGQFDNVYTIFDVAHYADHTDVKFVGTSTGNQPLNNLIPRTGNFSVNVPEFSGHWVAFNTLDPQSCCGLAAYGVSETHKNVVPGSNYHSDFRRVFNNPKNIRQSNRDRKWREDYDLYDDPIAFANITDGERLDFRYPSVSGVEVDHRVIAYPILMSGGLTPVVATGTGNIMISGNPLFERELSYYGNFYETDKLDDLKRSSQSVNRGIGKNGTCYTKKATLEVFPETLVQYDKYEPCGGGEAYATNNLNRLRFVYRGCDFHDECLFDDQGLPLGAWKNHDSEPKNINDLRRMLGGQEIHMFINLNSAWGGRVKGTTPCSCDGSIPGTIEPRHVSVHSPATFPNFLNFDLDPVKYGCNDPRHQISQIINRGLLNTPETAGFPSEYCDPLTTCEDIFGSNLACLARQPYTTYGYIMNLCGKEESNRKNVIKKAFEKLHQEKTITNANPIVIDPSTGERLEEPVYWSVTAPTPAPYSGNGLWGSGSIDSEGSSSPFQQIAGSGYGFWGLTDKNKQLVAPYFTTRNGEFISCDTVHTDYVDFSVTGTFQNVLETSNGWPTSAVPFLIEIETLDGCNGCAVTQMKKTNLTLEIEGLTADYFSPKTGTTSPDRSLFRAGHIHCKYGPTVEDAVGGGKVYKGVSPSFTCEDGFDTSTCSGLVEGGEAIWLAHTGNTCQCANGFSCTLYPIPLSGTTDRVLGWTSNPGGTAAGLVEIEGCSDPSSSYFDVAYDEKAAGGYRIFAEFNLTCPSLHTFLTTAEYPDAKYEGDTLTSMYALGGCGHHYPAQMGRDLSLETTFYMISNPHVDTFLRLSEFALKRLPYMQLGNGVIYPPSEINFFAGQEQNYFGTCPGDYVYAYGCKPEGTWFYGCQDDEGRYQAYAACEDATPCNTCPVGDGEGEVTCICDYAVGYEGIIPRPLPIEYQFNECDCLCTEPHLIAIYQINDYNSPASESGLTLISGEFASCAVPYYMSTLGSPPISIRQGPPHPYMGITFGADNADDYFDWSHGVNAITTGVNHLVYPTYLGREELISQTECPQLTIDQGIEGHVPLCEDNTSCTLDTSYGTRTCGPKIYANLENNGAVNVRKRKCHPEVAIVTKVECVGSSYKLHISREYHEHNRTWATQEAFLIEGSDPPAYEYRCVPVNAGGYLYNDGVVSGCSILPYSVLSDSVTPVTNAPCSIHPSSGVYVNQDYKHEYPDGQSMHENRTSVELPSGSYVWNYFNAFYKNTLLPSVSYGQVINSLGLDESGYYQCDTTKFPPETVIQNALNKTVFSTTEYNNPSNFKGIFATNQKHSCVQDATQCGGDLFCNKLFFPRHSYNAGTRIARFGVSQICTMDNTPEPLNFLDGYRESSGTNSVVEFDSGLDLLREASKTFVDWCNDDNIQFSLYDIDIDDNYLYVNDYLPLLGVVHPGWRYTSDTKSCTIVNSGCNQDLGLHTEVSILSGAHRAKTWANNKSSSMGYYLDKYAVTYSSTGLVRAYESSNCLFTPFKIHIDVECSTNRIARSGYVNDPPTYLQGVQYWDSRTCLGIYGSENCSCAGTQCKYATKNVPGDCTLFKLSTYEATVSSDSSGACLCIDNSNASWWHPTILDAATPVESTRACSGCLTGGGAEGEDWAIIQCGPKAGKAVRRESNASYVKLWQCDEYQYLYKHPGEYQFGSGFTECDCKFAYVGVEGLCGASYRCTDYSSCACNPVVSGTVEPIQNAGSVSGQWWRTDCHCDDYPQDDYGGVRRCEDSIIKYTITEE